MDVETRILLAQRAIRKKYNELRRGYADERVETEKQLAPIIKPLKTLVDLTSSPEKRNLPSFKKEIKNFKSEDEDADVSGLFENSNTPLSKSSPIKTALSSTAEDVEQQQQQTERQDAASLPQKTGGDDEVDDDDDDVVEVDVLQKTPHEILEESYRQNPRLSGLMHRYISENLGVLGKRYFSGLIDDVSGQYDNVYGVYLTENNWKLGSHNMRPLRDDTLVIGDKSFSGSEGLYELIFKSKPEKSKITDSDIRAYTQILDYTSAHRRQHEPSGRVKSNTGFKYKNFIKPIYNGDTVKLGSGFVSLSEIEPHYTYWNDPNELVERLVLLIASRNCGNSSHDSEIASIEAELREYGCIV